MFYQVEISLLKPWRIFVDDCVNFQKLYCEPKGNCENLELFYSKVFQTKEVVQIDSTLPENHSINTTWLDFDLCDYNDLSKGGQRIYDDFKELRYYKNRMIHKDTFNPKFGKVIVIGWHNITDYQDLNITFISNNFEKSLMYKVFKNSFVELDVEMKFPEVDLSRITFHYFVDSTEGVSKKKLQNPTTIREIQNFFSTFDPSKYFWCTNNPEKNQKVRLNLDGHEVTPNQRGVNHLKSYNTCIYMAGMNASTDSYPIYDEIWMIDKDSIKAEWEYESLYQIIFRGVIRDRSSTEQMHVYVYDKSCLEYFPGAQAVHEAGVVSAVSKPVGKPPLIVHNRTLHENSMQWIRRNKKDKETLLDKWDKWKSKQKDLNTEELAQIQYYDDLINEIVTGTGKEQNI